MVHVLCATHDCIWSCDNQKSDTVVKSEHVMNVQIQYVLIESQKMHKPLRKRNKGRTGGSTYNYP